MAKPPVLSPQQQRFNILYNADRAGKELRPEHKAELEKLISAGFSPTVTAVSQDTIAGNIRQAANMREKVDRALSNVSGKTTGIGGAILGNIPGSSGRDLRGDIDTLKANLTFDELKKLKNASPTGASGLGALSDTEGRLLAATVANLDPAQSEERLRENLQQVADHYDSWVKSLGYSDDQVKQATGGANPFSDSSATPPIIKPPADGAPPGPSAGGPPAGDPPTLAPDQLSLSTGGVRNEMDPEKEGLRNQIAGMIAAGASAKAIRNTIASAGIDPAEVSGIDENVAFRKANPRYKGGYDVQIGMRAAPMGTTRSALAKAAASPVGAYGMTAADTILGGGLDELAPGNSNLNRLGINAVQAANPNATGIGLATGIAGNVATAIGGEAALTRGIPALGKFAAPLADTAFGAASGALSNNDDRLTGALTGGGLALGGGVLGRTIVSGVGRAIAPSGGKLTELYDAGVRPTIGQRFAGTGVVGNAVNGVEEVLQSFPGLGFMVRGARQKARDQFERGAFNSALGEIGQKLPHDAELGTAPHAIMQKMFSDAYDKVLPNMRAVADEGFSNATQGILDQVTNGGLSDDSAKRFSKIIEAQVTRRFSKAGVAADSAPASLRSAGSSIPGTGDLWTADRPTLEKALKEASFSDDEKLVQALGEDEAKEFKRLGRAQNSMDPRRADAAGREFDERFGQGKLTPEQERLVYGIGETNAQADDIREVLNAHNDLAASADDKDWLGYVAALGARHAGANDLAAVTRGEGTAKAQAAFVRLGGAYRQMAAQGVPASEIPQRMAAALVKRGGWRPEQAAEVIGGFTEDMARAGGARPIGSGVAVSAPSVSEPSHISGEDLKAAISSIGKHISNLRSSPQGDRELASVLEDYLGELKASAMRNSDPGAAAALDAVDRGYAKSVRIEDAASARGGDTGRFTPQQFDRYVQKDAGGIRSRSYLRGDALFGDYAQAGKSLADRIPNSGTPERMMTMQALGGAPVMSALGYASPVSAALVGAATLPYAPIVRDGVGAAMAPRASQTLRTLGDMIRERAALAGGAGAAFGSPAYNYVAGQ